MSAVSRAAESVTRWVRWYTRGLPERIATSRRAELASDLHEHQAMARQAAVPDGVTRKRIVARALRGVPGDLSWARAQLRATTPAGARASRRLLELIAMVALGLSIVVSARILIGVIESSALEWSWTHAIWTTWTPWAAIAVLSTLLATACLLRATIDVLLGAASGARWLAAGNLLVVASVFFGMEYVWARVGYAMGRVVQVLGLPELTVPVGSLLSACSSCSFRCA